MIRLRAQEVKHETTVLSKVEDTIAAQFVPEICKIFQISLFGHD